MRFGERLTSGELVSQWMTPKGRTIKPIGAASDTISGGFRTIVWNASGELIISGLPITVEYLVVGGGGGGQCSNSNSVNRMAGGGGGGGGVLAGASLLLPVGTHEIVVGSGGSAGTDSPASNATNGSPSYLSGYVAAFGGGRGCGVGAVFSEITRLAGASTGGALAGNTTPAEVAPVLLMPTSQGNVGGGGVSTTAAGGGGGAGGVGGSAPGTSQGGNGGAGISNSITGTAVTYGGGGGGAGSTTAGTGTDGGGNGARTGAAATAGAANRGGGGGGGASSTNFNGSAGGSGVVIIRYAV